MNPTNKTITTWRARPISWSQLSSFAYDPTQWFDRYVLGKETQKSAAMLFGNEVGDSFATTAPLVKDIVTYTHMEYPLEAKLGSLALVGYADSYDPATKSLREYKTSYNKTKWTQKSVDTHGQLTMYALLLWLQDKVHPRDLTIHLDWIETRETGDFGVELVPNTPIRSFETKRTMNDILFFASYIQKTRREMEDYVINSPHLDTIPT